ncbi:hypothetical protein Tco_1557230, partial [Tanacetum coccineum]
MRAGSSRMASDITMDERLSSSFNVSSARCFDRFIVSSGLVDVKLEG